MEDAFETYLFVIDARVHIVIVLHLMRITSRATVELDAIGSRGNDSLPIGNRLLRRMGFKRRRLLLGIEARGYGSRRSIDRTLSDAILAAGVVEVEGGRGGIGIHANELVLAGCSRR